MNTETAAAAMDDMAEWAAQNMHLVIPSRAAARPDPDAVVYALRRMPELTGEQMRELITALIFQLACMSADEIPGGFTTVLDHLDAAHAAMLPAQ